MNAPRESTVRFHGSIPVFLGLIFVLIIAMCPAGTIARAGPRSLSWNVPPGTSSRAAHLGTPTGAGSDILSVTTNRTPGGAIQQVYEGVNLTGNASGGTPPYTYRWFLGDGANRSGSTVENYTYEQTGTYVAVLQVTDSEGNYGFAPVTIPVYAAFGGPAVNYTASERTTSVGVAISFRSYTSGFLGKPSSFQWSWGDGTSGSGQNATHSYLSGGDYPVSLFVSDVFEETAISIGTIYVAPSPSAGVLITAANTTGYAPVDTQFNASTRGGWSEVTCHTYEFPPACNRGGWVYNWSFGDGSYGWNSPVVDHTYRTPGTVTTTLAASDELGRIAGSTEGVTVSTPPALSSLNLSANRTTGSLPPTVSCTAEVTGGVAPFHFLWTFFDDNATFATPEVNCTFHTDGPVGVSLQVTDSVHQTRTAFLNVTGGSPPSSHPSGESGPGSSDLDLAGISVYTLIGVVLAVVVLAAVRIYLQTRKPG